MASDKLSPKEEKVLKDCVMAFDKFVKEENTNKGHDMQWALFMHDPTKNKKIFIVTIYRSEEDYQAAQQQRPGWVRINEVDHEILVKITGNTADIVCDQRTFMSFFRRDGMGIPFPPMIEDQVREKREEEERAAEEAKRQHKAMKKVEKRARQKAEKQGGVEGKVAETAEEGDSAQFIDYSDEYEPEDDPDTVYKVKESLPQEAKTEEADGQAVAMEEPDADQDDDAKDNIDLDDVKNVLLEVAETVETNGQPAEDVKSALQAQTVAGIRDIYERMDGPRKQAAILADQAIQKLTQSPAAMEQWLEDKRQEAGLQGAFRVLRGREDASDIQEEDAVGGLLIAFRPAPEAPEGRGFE